MCQRAAGRCPCCGGACTSAVAGQQGCSKFASDCEFGKEDSLRFHLKAGFEEANRIIYLTKRLT